MVAECLFLWRPDEVCFCDCEGKEKVQTTICRLLTTISPFRNRHRAHPNSHSLIEWERSTSFYTATYVRNESHV